MSFEADIRPLFRPDDPWPEERVQSFRAWIDAGAPP